MFSWLNSLLGPKPSPHRAPDTPAPAPRSGRNAKRTAEQAKQERELIARAIHQGQLPEAVAETIDVSGHRQPFRLPSKVRCIDLNAADSALAELPSGIAVANRIDLTGCTALTSLPAGLKTGTLVLKNCTGLTALPENLEVSFLYLDGCTNLRRWPDSARVTAGRVSAKGCAKLENLPAELSVATLDLSGCAALKTIPPGVQVMAALKLAGSGVQGVPAHLGEAIVPE